jgi:hypothetical protein
VAVSPIAGRSIAPKASIVRRKIATRTTALSLAFLGAIDSLSGATSFTATTDCYAFIYGYGGGGSGTLNGGHNGGGGGGGAAGFKKIRLAPGQAISWVAGAAGAANAANSTSGNNGGDTIVTVPGFVLVAGGGKGGIYSTAASAAGGILSGPWDIARVGGLGGQTGNLGAPPGSPGGSPAGGGIGGAASGDMGGGGGSAGFTDLLVGSAAAAGNGSAAAPGGGGAAGGFPGGGSGCSDATTSAAGGAGRVLVYLFKVAGLGA